MWGQKSAALFPKSIHPNRLEPEAGRKEFALHVPDERHKRAHSHSGRRKQGGKNTFLTGLCAWKLLVSTHDTDTPGLMLRRAALPLCFVEAIVEDRNIWKLGFTRLHYC